MTRLVTATGEKDNATASVETTDDSYFKRSIIIPDVLCNGLGDFASLPTVSAKIKIVKTSIHGTKIIIINYNNRKII